MVFDRSPAKDKNGPGPVTRERPFASNKFSLDDFLSAGPQRPTYTDLRHDFYDDYYSFKTCKPQIAADMVEAMSTEDVRRDGAEILVMLLELGQLDLAERMKSMLRESYDNWEYFGELPTRTESGGTLIIRATRAVRDGDHELAFELLELAATYAQLMIVGVSQMRHRYAQHLNTPEYERGNTPPMYFGQEPSELLRRVYQVYPEAERSALLEGNTALASHLQGLGVLLEARLPFIGEMLPSGTPYERRDKAHSGIATRNLTKFQEGEEFKLHVTDGTRSEMLGPMTNMPNIADLNRHEGMLTSLEATVNAVRGQESIIADLYRYPEIRAKYGENPPELQDIDQRVEVWATLWPALARDADDPLRELIHWIERYLRVFTVHSGFDIRDFGESYLDRGMPRDLLGRVIQDCGVYALTVAYELLTIARRAKLDVEFKLVTAIDHAMLEIIDHDKEVFYILSNNDFTGPFALAHDGEPRTKVEDPINQLVRVYGNNFEHENTFARLVEFDLADSSSARGSDKATKQELWRRYQLSTKWGFSPRFVGDDPNQEYFDHRRSFDQISQTLYNHLVSIDPNNVSPEQVEFGVRLGLVLVETYEVNKAREYNADTHARRAQQREIGATPHFRGSSRGREYNPLRLLAGLLRSGVPVSPNGEKFLAGYARMLGR